MAAAAVVVGRRHACADSEFGQAEEAGQSAPSPFSDATDATIDAAGAMAPDTEPASPASTSGGAFDDFGASGSHRLASRVSAEELLAASEGLAAASGDVRGAPRRRDGEDGLPSARHPADAGADMSSSSYFGTHVKRPPPATDRAAPERGAAAQRASPALVQDPFPKAREAVLMDRLADASHKVWGLRSAVGEAMGRTQVRPLEVQQILQAAEGVLARTRLSEAELEQVGWPSQAIRQMRDALSCLEVWERCEEGAKQAIANEQAALPALTGALEQVMAGWCQLCRLQGGALRLDVGLERRATSAGPMVSALLDKAMGLLRGAPDVVAARRLEALLQRGTRQRELQGFSVAIGAAQHLQEIGDLASGISAEAVGSRPGQARGARLAVPELLWKAVMDGDSRTVQAVIQHGGLVSGRAEDPQGHTVFWDALAFQRVDVALLLLRHFPPGTSYGVCLGEQHQRSGNSLLHLAAGLANFTSNAEALFAALFDQVPDGLKAHRNKRGQTIAHTAASRPNFWVLRFLAARSFDSLLVAEDNEGLTPCQMLESAMDSLGVPDLLQPLDASASRMPSWCPLRSFQPLAAGQRPPLSDAVVTVDDAARGRVDFHVHRIVLATSSTVWHRVLLGAALPDGAGGASSAVLLALDDQQCSSAEVALFALRFLYTGDTDCPFRGDPSMLLQLLRLCASCGLPAPLSAVALDALCQHVDVPEVARELLRTVFPAGAARVHVPVSHRAHVARCLICRDAVWQAAEEDDRPRLLEEALASLEQAWAARQERHAWSQAAASVAMVASGQLASTGPLGSGWLQPAETPWYSGTAAASDLSVARSEASTVASFHRLG